MLDHTHHRSTVMIAAAILSALLGACHKTPVDQGDTGATGTPAGTMPAPNGADANSANRGNAATGTTSSSNSGRSGTDSNTSGGSGAAATASGYGAGLTPPETSRPSASVGNQPDRHGAASTGADNKGQ